MRLALALVAATSFAALLAPITAFAEESAPPASTDDRVAEVIVTAQRRAETLQSVPVSVAVTTGQQFRSLNLTNIDDLQFVSPDFSFTEKSEIGNEGVSIRGIGTVALLSNGVEQSVGAVIDGVVIGRINASIGDLTDINRIEVLRGPQGTLFGKNASAGVISIITNNPTFSRSLDAYVSYGSLEEVRAEVTGNMPIGENSAIRLNLFTFQRDGITDNIYDGRKVGGLSDEGLRLKFLAKPLPNLSLLTSLDYTHRDDSCCNFVTRRQAPGGYASTHGDPIVGSSTNTTGDFNSPIYTKFDNVGGSVTVDWTPGPVTLTSISAARHFRAKDDFDADGGPTNSVSIDADDYTADQYSQELRLANTASSRLSYVAGVFAFRQVFHDVTTQAGSLDSPIFFGQQFTERVTQDNIAGFAQATFRVTERLRLIAGGRYTHERDAEDFKRTFMPGLTWPGAIEGSTTGATSLDKFSWRAGAQYDFTANIMGYATASTGFKGPAVNPSDSTNAIQFTRPEDATSYELGLKTRTFDGRLVANLALYDTKIEGFQAPVLDESVEPPTSHIVNAGALLSRGVDLDITARPIRSLTLSGGISYADTQLESFGLVPCYAGQSAAQGCIGGFFNPTGQPAPNAPRYTATLTVRYDFPIHSSAFDGFVLANGVYRSKVNFELNADPGTIQTGYGLFNLSAGIRTRDGRYELSFYVRNLLGQSFVAGISPNGLDGPGGYFQYVTPEAIRRGGVTLRTHF